MNKGNLNTSNRMNALFGKLLSSRVLMVLMLALLVVFLAACSSQGGSPSPPTGPIGGGCG